MLHIFFIKKVLEPSKDGKKCRDKEKKFGELGKWIGLEGNDKIVTMIVESGGEIKRKARRESKRTEEKTAKN